MSILYIDEYEPSCAQLKLQDPIYKVSKDNEQITVGKFAPLSSAIYLLPILVVGGIVAAWWILKKS